MIKIIDYYNHSRKSVNWLAIPGLQILLLTINPKITLDLNIFNAEPLTLFEYFAFRFDLIFI